MGRLAQSNAVIDECIDFIGFVKHRIDAQLRAALTDVCGSVVAQNHNFLLGPTVAASRQYAESAALL